MNLSAPSAVLIFAHVFWSCSGAYTFSVMFAYELTLRACSYSLLWNLFCLLLLNMISLLFKISVSIVYLFILLLLTCMGLIVQVWWWWVLKACSFEKALLISYFEKSFLLSRSFRLMDFLLFFHCFKDVAAWSFILNSDKKKKKKVFCYPLCSSVCNMSILSWLLSSIFLYQWF